jgi:hypothetical protein
MMEDNPFKRDEREDMKAFWLRTVIVCGAGFWACVIAAWCIR